MKFYELVESENGCHCYKWITDPSKSIGEFFTADEVCEVYAEVGQHRQPEHLNRENRIYVPGKWDTIHITNLVQKYKKKIGKRFPKTIYLETHIGNYHIGNWEIPQYIQDKVVVELQKLFPKKYKFVNNALYLINAPLLSEHEVVVMLNRVVCSALFEHVNKHLSIKSTDMTTAGVETSIKVKISCGVKLEHMMKCLDSQLTCSYRKDNPMFQKYRKQIIATFKRLAKNKKIEPTVVA